MVSILPRHPAFGENPLTQREGHRDEVQRQRIDPDYPAAEEIGLAAEYLPQPVVDNCRRRIFGVT